MKEKNKLEIMQREIENESTELDTDSVYGMLTEEMRRLIDRAKSGSPHLFEMDEQALKAYLKKAGLNLTATDHRVRLKFWNEYESAVVNHAKKINISNIIYGVCSREFFYSHYLTIDSRVAWMMCVPTSYSAKVEEALEYGIDQLRDLLEEPHKGNVAMARLKLDIVKMLDQRVRGAIVQKTMSLQLNADKETTKKVALAMTEDKMKNLRKKLSDLRMQHRRLENGGILVERTEEVSKEPKGRSDSKEDESDDREGTTVLEGEVVK